MYIQSGIGCVRPAACVRFLMKQAWAETGVVI